MAGAAARSLAGIDVTTPNHARVYDYFLGGKDNFAADRLAAEKIAQVAPDTALLARANRGFLSRAVRVMIESGVRQFLDLGTGIPTSPSVHEVARALDPSIRVVYVDNDPVVTTHNSALLATADGVVSVTGDVRQPEEILNDQHLRAVIDFDEPVGLLCVAVLHLVTDTEEPAGIMARFHARLAPGSHAAICQFAAESHPAGIRQFEEIYANAPVKVTFRPCEQIRSFFGGLDILPPGVVEVGDWRPDMQPLSTRLKILGGVGRKR